MAFNKKCISITARCTPSGAYSDSLNFDCDGRLIITSPCAGTELSYPILEIIDSGNGIPNHPYVYLGSEIRMKIVNYNASYDYLIADYMTREDDIITWTENVDAFARTINVGVTDSSIDPDDGDSERTISSDAPCILTTKLWIYPDVNPSQNFYYIQGFDPFATTYNRQHDFGGATVVVPNATIEGMDDSSTIIDWVYSYDLGRHEYVTVRDTSIFDGVYKVQLNENDNTHQYKLQPQSVVVTRLPVDTLVDIGLIDNPSQFIIHTVSNEIYDGVESSWILNGNNSYYQVLDVIGTSGVTHVNGYFERSFTTPTNTIDYGEGNWFISIHSSSCININHITVLRNSDGEDVTGLLSELTAGGWRTADVTDPEEGGFTVISPPLDETRTLHRIRSI